MPPSNPMLSSVSDEWFTPSAVADPLNAIGIDLDPCAHPLSRVRTTATYDIRNTQDGLALPWYGRTYANPPYSDLAAWIEKAATSYNETIDDGSDTIASESAPYPSAILLWRGTDTTRRALEHLGHWSR